MISKSKLVSLARAWMRDTKAKLKKYKTQLMNRRGWENNDLILLELHKTHPTEYKWRVKICRRNIEECQQQIDVLNLIIRKK